MRNWKYAKKENYAVKKSEVPYTQKSSTDTVSDTFAFDPPPPDPDTLRVISVCADEGMPLSMQAWSPYSPSAILDLHLLVSPADG